LPRFVPQSTGAKVADAVTHEERIRQDERNRLRTEQVDALKALLADYRADLKDARDEIQKLRTQARWDRVLGAIPLIGVAAMFFMGGF